MMNEKQNERNNQTNTMEETKMAFTFESYNEDENVLAEENVPVEGNVPSEQNDPMKKNVPEEEFDPYQPKPVSCIYLQPGKKAELITFSPTLENLQELCEGNIECVHFFAENDLLLVCNESGKILNMAPSRAIYYKGEIADVIAGPFLIMQEDEMGEFVSIENPSLDKYLQMFLFPEEIHVKNGQIVVERYNPSSKPVKLY